MTFADVLEELMKRLSSDDKDGIDLSIKIVRGLAEEFTNDDGTVPLSTDQLDTVNYELTLLVRCSKEVLAAFRTAKAKGPRFTVIPSGGVN